MTIKPQHTDLPTPKFLKDHAYNQIKRDILSGQLTSGTFWSERTLAERLQLGKAPVRDAINRLQQENYLVVMPQQGIVVRQLTAKDIDDTFEARLIIEPQVASRLAGRLPQSDRLSLEANLAHQSECVAKGDAMAFIKWDVEFHIGMVTAHGNADLVRMMERICERTFQAIRHAFAGSPSRLAPALKAHKGILSAIVQGDSELALLRMTNHITHTRNQNAAQTKA